MSYSTHCKKLAPEYVEAASILEKKKPTRYLAKVDATKNEILSRRFEI